ncbi:MAG: hypothetical protein KGP28_01685 [Bdellovibrionales bacterium]|nr:hypothetical protein [Bdellovibrionales bacterium]
MPRTTIGFLLSLSLLFNQASRAEGASESLSEVLGTTFSARTGAWGEDKRFTSDEGIGVTSAWLTLRPKEVAGLRFSLEGYGMAENVTRKPRFLGDLREGFVETSIGAFDIRAGRQVLVWGRADKLNPTDNLSVKDYRLLTTDDEEQRLGLTTLSAAWNLSEGSRLVLIWQPEWRAPGLPIPPLGQGITLSNLQPSGASRQWALKYDRSSSSFDFSLSFFDGISRTPDLELMSAGPSGVDLELAFRRVQVIGADFASTLDGWGIRGETAYMITQDPSGSNPLIQNAGVFTVLGAERSLTEGLSISAQYLNRWVDDFRDITQGADPTNRPLLVSQAINTQQQVRMNHGFSLRPALKMMNETLEMELAWVGWLTTGGQLLRPKITYAITDHFKAIAGAEFYSGPSESFFGRLRDVSSAFAEIRATF